MLSPPMDSAKTYYVVCLGIRVMDLVSVIGGGQNSGKTTAVVEIVKELKRRGYAVGAIKQIHEEGFTIDRKGKDTWRFMEAGAEMVVAAAPGELAAMKRTTKDDRLAESLNILKTQNLNIVVVEGHPGMKVPMVYSLMESKIPADKPIDDSVVCVVSLNPELIDVKGLPVFHTAKDVSKVVDLLLKGLTKKKVGAG